MTTTKQPALPEALPNSGGMYYPDQMLAYGDERERAGREGMPAEKQHVATGLFGVESDYARGSVHGWNACRSAMLEMVAAPTSSELTASDYEEVLADHRRLVRELDIIINGEDGAAKQASLCDIVSQLKDRLPFLRAELRRALDGGTHV